VKNKALAATGCIRHAGGLPVSKVVGFSKIL